MGRVVTRVVTGVQKSALFFKVYGWEWMLSR